LAKKDAEKRLQTLILFILNGKMPLVKSPAKILIIIRRAAPGQITRSFQVDSTAPQWHIPEN